MTAFFESLKQEYKPENAEEQKGLSFFQDLKAMPEAEKLKVIPKETSSIPKQIVKEGAAGFLGTYGDIAQLLGIQKPGEKPLLPGQEERFKREARATPQELISMVGEEEDLMPEYAKLPTSEDVRKAAKDFFGIGEARTPTERIAGRTSGALGGAAALGAGLLSATAGGAGGATGQTTQELGGPEWLATTVDIGTNLGAGVVRALINKGTATKLAGSLYGAAEKSITENAAGNASELERNLLNLNKKMKLGTRAPSEKAIIDETEEILGKIKDGKLSYMEAAASKRSLSEKMMKLVYETPDKAAKARARKLFGNIQEDLREFIKTSEKTYPEFYNNLTQADLAFSAIAKSRVISDNALDFLKSKLGGSSMSGALGLAYGLGYIKPILIGTALIPAAKTGEFIYRFFKSPALRKHYNSLLNSAMKDSKQGMFNSLRRINETMEDDPEIMAILNEKP